MSITIDETTTLADIDEALNHLCETLKQSHNAESLKTIIDGLLDERLELKP